MPNRYCDQETARLREKLTLGLTEIGTADPADPSNDSSSGGDSVYRLSVIPSVKIDQDSISTHTMLLWSH